MKVRTQIQLDPEDHRALKQAARDRGISMSAAVRWLIRENLSRKRSREAELIAGFRNAAGALEGDKTEGTVSRDHDRWLYGEASG